MADAILRRARRALRRGMALTLTVAGGLVLLFVVAAPAFAEDKYPQALPTGKAEELSYSLSLPTAALSFGLLIVFYIMLFVMSEKEFKGVVNERFGPKR